MPSNGQTTVFKEIFTVLLHVVSSVRIPPMLTTMSTIIWIKKCKAGILAVKRSAGVTPEVSLRNMQVTKYTSKESTLALKPRTEVTNDVFFIM